MQKMMTRDNILDMLTMVGTMEYRQLIRFFSSESRPETIDMLLKDLRRRHEITYDEETKSYSCLGAPGYEPFLVRRRSLALEAIAGLGSNAVYSVQPLEYPNLFEVCLPDSTTLDYAVIDTVNDALTAARYRAKSIPLGLEDTTVHFAILYNGSRIPVLEKDLRNSGFDHICLVDNETKEVRYVRL